LSLVIFGNIADRHFPTVPFSTHAEILLATFIPRK
jgi:hypothetical protein